MKTLCPTHSASVVSRNNVSCLGMTSAVNNRTFLLWITWHGLCTVYSHCHNKAYTVLLQTCFAFWNVLPNPYYALEFHSYFIQCHIFGRVLQRRTAIIELLETPSKLPLLVIICNLSVCQIFVIFEVKEPEHI